MKVGRGINDYLFYAIGERQIQVDYSGAAERPSQSAPDSVLNRGQILHKSNNDVDYFG